MIKQILLISLLFSSLFADVNWVYSPFETLNYDEKKVPVMAELLSQELSLSYDIETIVSPNNGTTEENRAELCNQNSAEFGFSGKFTAMDDKIYLFIKKWNSQGEIIYRERVIFENGEEYHLFMGRVARMLVDEQKFNETLTSKSITKSDQQADETINLIGRLMGFGRIGVLYPLDDSFKTITEDYSNRNGYSYYSSSNDTLDTTITYDESSVLNWELGIGFDLDPVIVEIAFSRDVNRANHFLIAGEYIFSEKNISPYLGADVGVSFVKKYEYNYTNRYTDNNDRSTFSNGLLGGIRVGALIMRNHSVRIMPELRLFGIMNEEMDYGIRFTIGIMAF